MIYSEQNAETLVSFMLLGNEKAYEALVIRYQKAVIGAAFGDRQPVYGGRRGAGCLCLGMDETQHASGA